MHLGIGAFHRAHQAIYTQEVSGEDDDWHIIGVSLRSPDVRNALMPQNGLYTVTERANGTMATQLVSVVSSVLVADEDPETVIAAIADPSTSIVSLTVTEKGYYRDPATGGLQTDDPAIANDLQCLVPTTLYGFLAAGLNRRRAAGLGGLTLLSCDNLSGNGSLLMRTLTEFLGQVDPDLASWARKEVTTPNTMVDRIVPAATPAEQAAVAARIGMADAGALVTEPFRQWVIEDRFVGARPRWERAGAQIVSDVTPFELAKLRLLNGSHSTLAYAGLQLGHTFVHQAIADPALRDFVLNQMREEVLPGLAAAPGLDATAYIQAILERFDNADLDHRLDQIAIDGSQKLPQRWIKTVEERLTQHLESPRHLLSIAAWIAYTENGSSMARDPLTSRYRAIWAAAAGDVSQVVKRFVADLGLFPLSFRHLGTMTNITNTLTAWRARGPRPVLEAAIHGTSDGPPDAQRQVEQGQRE